ncbi:MAG: ASCH domain-containing protein [Planctomycetota bacterium]
MPLVLLFKRKFLDAIRRGEKTQTIRLWKHRMMRAGQLSHIPGVGRVRITQVDTVEIDTLTDEDARPDGFATADDLRRELRSIYADRLNAGYQAFRVRFERVEAETPAPMKAPRDRAADGDPGRGQNGSLPLPASGYPFPRSERDE